MNLSIQVLPETDKTTTMDVLIVDDERLARQRMEDLLADREATQLVGSVGDGQAAVEAIRDLDPDLVLLDVQMPGMTGLEVLEEIGPEEVPLVIFVTAYEEYAVEAFELAALDYLTKPYQDERFEQAFSRARDTLEKQDLEDFRKRLEQILEGKFSEGAFQQQEEYVSRISVQGQGTIKFVPVEEVDFFAADRAYVEVHASEKTHVIRKSLGELEEMLDPAKFCRIHRSHIVRLDRIEAMLVKGGGHCAVRLEDGRTLKVSRTRRDELEERLGV